MASLVASLRDSDVSSLHKILLSGVLESDELFLNLRCFQQLGCGEECSERIILKSISATLLSIHQTEHGDHLHSRLFGSLDRFQSRSAGCADIIHDDDSHPWARLYPLNKLLSPVLLRLLPDNESGNGRKAGAFCETNGSYCRDDWVGSEGETADCLGPDPLLLDLLQHQPSS